MPLVPSLDGVTYDLDDALLEQCRIPQEALADIAMPSLPAAPPVKQVYLPGPHPWLRLRPLSHGKAIIEIGPPPVEEPPSF